MDKTISEIIGLLRYLYEDKDGCLPRVNFRELADIKEKLFYILYDLQKQAFMDGFRESDLEFMSKQHSGERVPDIEILESKLHADKAWQFYERSKNVQS